MSHCIQPCQSIPFRVRDSVKEGVLFAWATPEVVVGSKLNATLLYVPEKVGIGPETIIEPSAEHNCQ